MHEISSYISEKYSYEDICHLESLLDDIKSQKKLERDSKHSISNFYNEYIIYVRSTFSESYLKSVKLSFLHLLNFCGKDKPMKEFNVKDAEDFKRFVMEKAPKGYLVYLRTLKASFNIAKNWDWISDNAFSKIKFGRIQQVRPKFITRMELDLILQNVKSKELANIFLFGFLTGCRLGEIVNLKYKNINLSNRTIIIGDESFTSKNGKLRVIPIANELYAKVFEKIKIEEKESYVFAKPSGFRYNRDYVSRSFLHSRRLADLPEEIHFHSLRHSFASHLAIKNTPIITIKELLGHSSIISTQIYSHSNLEAKRAAIQKFDEIIPVV